MLLGDAGHAAQPACETDYGHWQCEDFQLFLGLDVELEEDWVVEVLNEELFRIELIDVGVSTAEVEFLYDFFVFSADEVDSSANLRADQNHSSAKHAEISGKIDFTIRDLFYLPILAVDSLHQAIHPNADKAMLGKQLHQHILILNRNVLLQPHFRVELPTYGVLISDDQH